jgi:hypothetical protein
LHHPNEIDRNENGHRENYGIPKRRENEEESRYEKTAEGGRDGEDTSRETRRILPSKPSQAGVSISGEWCWTEPESEKHELTPKKD